MKLEDERINKAPKPWLNFDSSFFRDSVWITIGTFMVALCFFLIDWYLFDLNHWVFGVLILLFSVLGIILMFIGYRFNTDHKSKWFVSLKYNHLLFELLAQKIPEILDEGNFEYYLNEQIKFPDPEVNPDTLETYARSYFIKSPYGEDLLFEFGLREMIVDRRSYYYFFMQMENIEVNNLTVANNFAHMVKKFLNAIEYEKFEYVAKEE